MADQIPIHYPSGAPPEEDNGDDFIAVDHIPNSHPSRYVVQIRRYRLVDRNWIVTQSSEPLPKRQAMMLAKKWAHWHRMEVR